MEKIKKAVEYMKNHNFERIMVELVLLALFFNVNIIIGCVLTAVVLGDLLLQKDYKNLLCAFIFLSFCDDILMLPVINWSVSRIVLILVFIKLIIEIIKTKTIPNKFQIGVALFFLISVIIEFFTKGLNTEVIAIFINILTFVGFSMVLKPEDDKQLDEFIEKLCYTFIIGVASSVVYGLATLNFMKYIQADKVIFRFNGTIEPNFMCMYIDLGVLALLTLKEKINKKVFYILLSLFICSAIWTSSVTGLGVLGVCCFVYFIIHRKQWKQLLKDFAVCAIIVVVVIASVKALKIGNLIEGKEYLNEIDISLLRRQRSANSYNGVNTRIGRLIELLKAGDFDEMTSGRTALSRTYAQAAFNRPVANILLGDGANITRVFCDYFGKECNSHNTYVDFLYNFGVVGFVLTVGFLLDRTIKNKFLNKKIKETKYSKELKLMRIMTLLYALTLTLYTRRMLLVLFLL